MMKHSDDSGDSGDTLIEEQPTIWIKKNRTSAISLSWDDLFDTCKHTEKADRQKDTLKDNVIKARWKEASKSEDGESDSECGNDDGDGDGAWQMGTEERMTNTHTLFAKLKCGETWAQKLFQFWNNLKESCSDLQKVMLLYVQFHWEFILINRGFFVFCFG